MTKIDLLRRLILPCFAPTSPTSAATATVTVTKKRLSTSLRDDIAKDHLSNPNQPKNSIKYEDDNDSGSTQSDHSQSSIDPVALPRSSKTMAIGTIFGPRRGGHVWFCIQHGRLSTKPLLLLELSIPTQQFVKEMRSSGPVRIVLECSSATAETNISSCPLRSVPMWAFSCNGKKLGFAAKRKASEKNRTLLKTMQSISVGAGVIPSSETKEEEIMYMRANYEHMVGSVDSESFHLINPDECSGQELSVFLIRTR